MTQQNRNDYFEEYREINHSDETLTQIHNISKTLLMREDSHHHFLLYHDKDDLAMYYEHNSELNGQLKKLSTLVKNPSQQRFLDSLQKLNTIINFLYAKTQNPRIAVNKSKSQLMALNKQGEIARTESMKNILARMELYEKNVNKNRSKLYNTAVNKTSLSFYSMVFFSIALTVLLFFFIMSDFKKRKAAENRLIENEKLLDAIFNESADAILLADDKLTRLEKFNKTADAKFSLSEGSTAVENFLFVFQNKTFGSNNLNTINSDAGKTDCSSNEFEFNAGSEKSFWGTVSVTPILRNNTSYKLMRIADISERKNAEKIASEYTRVLKEHKEKLEKVTSQLLKSNNELKKSKIELKQLNANKDKFLSIIAHDLRSPLSGVIGVSEYLTSESERIGKDELKECADSINITVKNIYKLLNNLLDWARIQAGRMEYKPEKLNLWLVTEELIELNLRVSTSKDITIKNYLDKSLAVHADYNMLSAIIRNLISNAVKYTNPGGHILIASHCSGAEAVITVKDSGVGMREDQIADLFQINKGRSTAGTAGEKGTGLGLILCRELVLINNGRIWVNSSQNTGSEFSFTLPAVNEEMEAPYSGWGEDR